MLVIFKKNNAHIIAKRNFQTMFVTEPACDKKQAHEAKLILNKKMKHAKIHVSKIIEEHTHKTGGTAIVQNTPKHIMHPKAKTKAFEQNQRARQGRFIWSRIL